jgi:uncharacterized protein (TIGR02246 family)
MGDRLHLRAGRLTAAAEPRQPHQAAFDHARTTSRALLANAAAARGARFAVAPCPQHYDNADTGPAPVRTGPAFNQQRPGHTGPNRGDLAMKSIVAMLVLMLTTTTGAVAGDLKDDLLAIEKSSWTAWSNKNGQFFKDVLTADAVQAVAGAGVTSGRDKIVADVSSHTCVVKSFSFADPKLNKLGDDAAVISYIATQDATCDGKALPAKVYSSAIYVRKDGKWRCTHYQETPL